MRHRYFLYLEYFWLHNWSIQEKNCWEIFLPNSDSILVAFRNILEFNTESAIDIFI